MNIFDLLSMNRQKPDPTRGTGHVFNPYGKNTAPRPRQSGNWMDKPALGGSMSRGDLLLASMGMLSGRNFQEGMGNAAQYMAYGMDKASERQKEAAQKAAMQKALSGMDLTPEQRALAGVNPTGVLGAVTERAFAAPAGPLEINGQLVDPKTYDVLGDYRTPEVGPDKYVDVPASELPPGTPPGLYKRNLTTNDIERVSAPSSPGVSLTLNSGDKAREDAFGKGLGQNAANEWQAIKTKGMEAATAIGKADMLDFLLGEIDYTGFGGRTFFAAQKGLQSLGFNVGDDVGAKEAAEALTKEMGLALKKDLPGPMSNADREFLMSIPASIAVTEAGNDALLYMYRQRNRYEYELMNYMYEVNPRTEEQYNAAIRDFNLNYGPIFKEEDKQGLIEALTGAAP